VLSLATMLVNLAIRALRWQYLLEPLGHTSFMNSFRATAVGFAASSVLPAAPARSFAPISSRARRRRSEGTHDGDRRVRDDHPRALLDTVTVLILSPRSSSCSARISPRSTRPGSRS
jgi:hypothetical protein